MDDLIIGLLGLVIGILGLLRESLVSAIFQARARFFPDAGGVTGYWVTRWEKDDDRPQSEVLRLAQFGRRLQGRVKFAVDPNSYYTLKARMSEENVVEGSWMNKNRSYRGQLHFTFGETLDSAQGWWTGISSVNKEVRCGEWKMHKLQGARSQLSLKLDLPRYREALRSVIERHEEQYGPDSPSREVTLGTGSDRWIELMIYRGVFDPTLGNISRSVLDYLELDDGSTVLDLGCGSGFLGIYLAKYCGAKVISVDVDSKCVSCTAANAVRNGVKEAMEQLQGHLFEPVRKRNPDPEQFDLIVATLPFSTRANYIRAIRRKHFASASIRASYASMFCSPPGLLRELILHAAYYLRSRGRLVFPVGGSSDLAAVVEAISLADLTLNPGRGLLQEIEGEDVHIIDIQKI